MTRVVKQWIRGVLSAFLSGVSGVLGMTFVDPADFNLDNPGRVALAALIFGIVGLVNFLAKSPLPPDDDDAVDVSRLSGIVLALLVGLGSAGCASVPRIAPLPAEVAAVDRNLVAAVGNLQQLLTMAAEVADTVSRIEDEAARGGVVPAAADAAFDQAMVAYAKASTAASAGLVSGAATTWPALRGLVEPVLARAQGLIDTAGQIGAIRGRVSGFLAQLRDLLSAAVGEFMFGGAR